MKFILSTPRLDYPLSEISIDKNDPDTKITTRCISTTDIPNLNNYYIELTKSFKFNNNSYLAISLNLPNPTKNELSIIQIYQCSNDNGNDHEYELVLELKDVTKSSADFIVDIIYFNNYLLTCSNRGLLTIHNLKFYDFGKKNNDKISVFYAQINEPVEFVSICEYESLSNLTILSGGYNNNLALYDLTQSLIFFKDKSPNHIQPVLSNYYSNLLNDNPYKNSYKSIVKLTPIWKVKNLSKNDDFIWIKKAIFLHTIDTNIYNSSTTTDNNNNSLKEHSIVSITKFGKLQFYNTILSRSPIKTFTISDHSLIFIKQLTINRIIFADCFNMIGIFDINSETIIETYRVPIGSISSILAYNLSPCNSSSTITRSKSISSNFSLNSLSSEEEEEDKDKDKDKDESPYHRRKRQVINSSELPLNVLIFIASIDKCFKCYRLLNNNKFNLIFSQKISSIVPDMCIINNTTINNHDTKPLIDDLFNDFDFNYYNKKSLNFFNYETVDSLTTFKKPVIHNTHKLTNDNNNNNDNHTMDNDTISNNITPTITTIK